MGLKESSPPPNMPNWPAVPVTRPCGTLKACWRGACSSRRLVAAAIQVTVWVCLIDNNAKIIRRLRLDDFVFRPAASHLILRDNGWRRRKINCNQDYESSYPNYFTCGITATFAFRADSSNKRR